MATSRLSLTTGKRWIKTALVGSGALRLVSKVTGQGIAILMYHSVLDEPEHQANTVDMGHQTETFRRQMEIIAHEYDPVSMDEVPSFVTGERPMPRRAVVITFDDGYADNLEVAAPILSHFGICATFYVSVRCVDEAQPPWVARVRYAFRRSKKQLWQSPNGTIWPLADYEGRETAFIAACALCARLTGEAQERMVEAMERELDAGPIPPEACRMLTWDQVRALTRGGHIVGSHTLSHPNLAHVGDDELNTEITKSRRRIQDEVGGPILHFAYPNPVLSPHWTMRTVAASRQAGYQTAVIATPGLVRQRDDLHSLHRLPASRNLEAFRWNLACLFLGRRSM